MSDELGPLTYGKKEEQIFLGREIAQHRDYTWSKIRCKSGRLVGQFSLQFNGTDSTRYVLAPYNWVTKCPSKGRWHQSH